MATLNFPDSPTTNQLFNAPNGVTYKWDGAVWAMNTGTAVPYLPLAGGTMVGDIILAADANAPLEPATLQQVSAANALLMPKAGGTFTGPVIWTGATAQVNLQLTTTGTTDSSYVYFGDSGSNTSGAIGYNHSTDALQFRATGGLRLELTGTSPPQFYPTNNNAVNLGAAGLVWKDSYSTRFMVGSTYIPIAAGANTPEAAVTAPVGSVYLRTNGAAGTTFYIKESGTGNTGWTALVSPVGSYMPIAGGTFTGDVIFGTTTATQIPVGTLAQRPTGAAGQIRYNSTSGKFEGFTSTWGELGGGTFYVNTTPPATPSQGSPWWNSEDGSLYLYYDDGAGAAQWVPATPFPAGGVVGASDLQSAEDNLIINGGVEIWQRGTTFASLSGATWTKTADRWWMYPGAGTTLSVVKTIQPAGQGVSGSDPYVGTMIGVQRSVTGTEDTQLYQDIENVKLVAGQTVTLSFVVWCAVTGSHYVYLGQNFGTGGSPSAWVGVSANFTVNQAQTHERKILSFAMPSISGKTIGTNGDDNLQLSFFVPKALGNVNTFFSNIDLRIGTVAPTKYLRRPIQQEFALCQRYYQVHNSILTTGYHVSGGTVHNTHLFPVQMRAIPTSVVIGTPTTNNATGAGVNSVSSESIILQCVVTSTGYGYAFISFGLDAEL